MSENEKMPLEEVEKIEEGALKEISEADSNEKLQDVKNRYLSKKGELNMMMGFMKELTGSSKAFFGSRINAAKNLILEAFQIKEKETKGKALEKKLKEEAIDLTLPEEKFEKGHTNPYWLIVDEMCDIFASMGFSIEEGNDVESDHYNFELLNVPKDHPARDMQDTFYLSDGTLLRTQTSAAQAHIMTENAEKGPIRMVCPGKCYRRDDDDMTHSHQFGQIEGLVVGEGVSLADLKGTLELFVKKMFGEKREIRFRSSFFPFTEPSVEVDVSCAKCGGKGCSMCKGTGWIEILGAGEVHPNVLRMCGYDTNKYSGFAFGVGIERVAMLRYGIDDIRRIYSNDVRFLKDFSGK